MNKRISNVYMIQAASSSSSNNAATTAASAGSEPSQRAACEQLVREAVASVPVVQLTQPKATTSFKAQQVTTGKLLTDPCMNAKD